MRKIPSTLQIAQTECGLCCVRSLLEYYGHNTSITELRKIKEPGRDGLKMKDLQNILGSLGMESKIFQVINNKIFHEITSPIIVFWKGYHFVCVESFTDQHVYIMDPSVGRIKITPQEFLKNFSGFILTAIKTEKFQYKRRKILGIWNKEYLIPKNMRLLYLETMASSLLIVGMTSSIPLITQFFIDYNLKRANTVAEMFIILLATFLFFIILSLGRTIFSIKIMYKFSWHLVNGAFTKLLSLPAKYFTVRSPGEIVYRLNSLGKIQDVLGPKLIQSFLDLISTFMLLVYVYYVSIRLGLIITGLIIFIFYFLIASRNRLNVATDREINEGSNAQNVQLDALVSINSVKLGGYDKAYLDDWRKKFKKLLAATNYRMKIQDGFISSILTGIQTFAPLIILVISLNMVRLNQISLGQALAVQTISSLIFVYSNSIFSTIVNFEVAGKYVQLAEDIFEYPSERVDGDLSYELTSGSFKLVDVSFKYLAGEKNSLNSLNLEVFDEETVAIVGVSGSGKTTLGKVISSLFEPSSGEIYYGDIQLNNFNLKNLRKSIGYIPQETHLHNRTIIENLKLGVDYTEDEIKQFCQKLQFLDFIDQMPMKYNTVVSDTGANFSGGQKQRIQIAKTLLQKPKIIVMDEATSALDNISQSEVYQALLKFNCTKIIIAHRLETILNADKIVVLNDGEIVQIGTHNELISQDGLYKDLYRSI